MDDPVARVVAALLEKHGGVAGVVFSFVGSQNDPPLFSTSSDDLT